GIILSIVSVVLLLYVVFLVKLSFSEKPSAVCDIGYIVPEWVDGKPNIDDIRTLINGNPQYRSLINFEFGPEARDWSAESIFVLDMPIENGTTPHSLGYLELAPHETFLIDDDWKCLLEKSYVKLKIYYKRAGICTTKMLQLPVALANFMQHERWLHTTFGFSSEWEFTATLQKIGVNDNGRGMKCSDFLSQHCDDGLGGPSPSYINIIRGLNITNPKDNEQMTLKEKFKGLTL
ncbi:hypothetical protein ACJX0J_023846, partial [Zea mays]